MTCANIMTPNPLSVHEGDTVETAAKMIVEHRYINLPVCDKSGKYLGMFGIYDLLALLVPRVAIVGNLLPNLRFMSDDVPSLHAKYEEVKTRAVGTAADRMAPSVNLDTPVIEAVRLFCRNHTTLPVVERGTGVLKGIVSYWDAARIIMGEVK